ncbi:MAG: hypothetical protein KJ749_05440 [Planctomycetes bacterium]|nr:hypothetical protein [Planctomycetota bacterium]
MVLLRTTGAADGPPRGVRDAVGPADPRDREAPPRSTEALAFDRGAFDCPADREALARLVSVGRELDRAADPREPLLRFFASAAESDAAANTTARATANGASNRR